MAKPTPTTPSTRSGQPPDTTARSVASCSTSPGRRLPHARRLQRRAVRRAAVRRHPAVRRNPGVRPGFGALPKFTQTVGGNVDGLTPPAAHARHLVTDTYGVTDIGGFATSGHGDVSDHHTGRAIDIMLTPRSAEKTTFDWGIAAYLQSNAQALGIKYLIWDGRIWSPARAGEGWRVYRSPDGGSNPTLLHLEHIHVSVL